MNKTSDKYLAVCICIGLVLMTLAVFWQVRTFDFINYDDSAYVTENRYVLDGLTGKSILWAFTTPHGGISYWHPLTWLSHMLDCELFGLKAGWHHLTNLLLHIVNTLLLFGVFKAMTGALWPSGFVAALFAIHPLHVESVAWISERKDVLSTLFWILTIGEYAHYVKNSKVSWYFAALLLFTLGLMSKPMLVTLPFVLLLLDWWPLGRFQNGRGIFYRLVLEKTPLFILSALSSIVTFLVQRSTGAVMNLDSLGINIRIANAVISYVRYILKMIWPSRLAAFYPYSIDTSLMWQAAGAALLLLGISILVIRLAQSHKYLPVGWFWFLGTLVPVIGLVQVGGQAMADRYTYMTLTGLFIMVGWGLADMLAKWHYRNIMLVTSAATVLAGFIIYTRIQVQHWKNSVTLCSHAINVTENNYIMHNNLGNALIEQEKSKEAMEHYRQAVQIKPDYFEAHNNLGNALLKQGNLDEAVSHYYQALKVNPDNADTHYNIGNALASRGEFNEAISHYRRALQLSPNEAGTYNNLGNSLVSLGKLNEAIDCFQKALQIDPDDAEAHNNLGSVLAEQGNLDEAARHYLKALGINPDLTKAHKNLGVILQSQGKVDESISHFRRAVQIKPDDADAHYDLGSILQSQGKVEEAIIHYRKVVEIRPDWPVALNSLAWLLATATDPNLHDAGEAIELAERAAGLTSRGDAYILDTLAAAYAAGGRYNEAIKAAQEALEIASAGQNEKLINHIGKQLELYKKAKSK